MQASDWAPSNLTPFHMSLCFMIVLSAGIAASMRFCECSARSKLAIQPADISIYKPSFNYMDLDALESKVWEAYLNW